VPGFVAQGANNGLNQQTRHGPGQIEQGQLCRVGIQKRVNGVDGRLLEAKTVLNPKEAEIHVDNLTDRKARLDAGHTVGLSLKKGAYFPGRLPGIGSVWRHLLVTNVETLWNLTSVKCNVLALGGLGGASFEI